jgi:hypothetical protein
LDWKYLLDCHEVGQFWWSARVRTWRAEEAPDGFEKDGKTEGQEKDPVDQGS